MSTLVSRTLHRCRIPLETSHVVVSEDGSIRYAADNEKEEAVEVTATKDMLPVPRDSDMRTWGFFSVMGFFVAEAFSISQVRLSSMLLDS